MLHLATNQRKFECMPYVLIQACMVNRKEYKVVCLDSEPQYVANIQTFAGMGTMFSSPPHVVLFEFVRNAIRALKSKVPGFMCEGKPGGGMTECAKMKLRENQEKHQYGPK